MLKACSSRNKEQRSSRQCHFSLNKRESSRNLQKCLQSSEHGDVTLIFPKPWLHSSPSSILIIRLLPASLCRQPGQGCPRAPQWNDCCATPLARGQPGLAFMDQQSHPRCITSCQRLFNLGTTISPRQVDSSKETGRLQLQSIAPTVFLPGGRGIRFSSASTPIVSLQSKYILTSPRRTIPAIN